MPCFIQECHSLSYKPRDIAGREGGISAELKSS